VVRARESEAAAAPPESNNRDGNVLDPIDHHWGREQYPPCDPKSEEHENPLAHSRTREPRRSAHQIKAAEGGASRPRTSWG
jgi:hypothetical protein